MAEHMAEHHEHEIREMLKQSLRPVDTDLQRDLWPQVLQKLDASPTRVAWYDWALIAASIGMVLAFPNLILLFAYHL